MKRIVLSSIFAVATGPGALARAPEGLPLDAGAGECFAQIITPESVELVTERVVETKATFETIEIPAQYATVQEKHLIREGTTVFKSVPAVYKTVPQEIELEPGLTKTVMKQVLVEPARVIEETIAPEYEMIEVQKLIAPAREERVEIPATYKTVERRVTSGGTAEWVPILCETNASPETISEIQAALTASGHPLAIDGKFGPNTFAAMKAFQAEQGLPVGVLTLSTVERLGVSLR